MQELINQITEAIEAIQDDVVKFDEKGNKGAAQNVRVYVSDKNKQG